MKCQSCGVNYYFRTRCPHCGRNGFEPKGAFARFLSLPLTIGSYTFNVLYLYFFIAVNVSVITGIVNLVVYQTMDGAGGIWAHYVIGGMFALFVLLRTCFRQPDQVLTTLRHLVYILLAVLAVTQLVRRGTGDYTLLAYVIPTVIASLSLCAFFAFALGWATSFSFYLTLAVDAGLSLVPFILAFNTPLSTAGCIINYVAFGVAMLSFVNAFFLKLLSTLFRAREGKSIL